MSDRIQLLPDSVANQIAAGEVIQRPASVIKELVENAVDAGATEINVLVTDAGRTQIQVVDNGSGMSDTDARLCFERHATSKIRKADDLFALQTMGFRGEALPSIAAVAQIELKTRRQNDEIGTHIMIAASRVESQNPVSCPVGSNFVVKNIFYNVPARRKFLKSNTTELNNILAAFERIVLVYPNIHFTFHSNGTELYNLRPAVLHKRIMDIFGKRMSGNLLSVDVDTHLCKITGFVGKADAARKKGVQQFFFVNGRFMRHPYFHKAVMSAFERLVPIGEQVPYFIYLTVPAADIDVNIHPTKTEIKFENEQAIWQILAAAVKEAVGKYHEVPTIDFDTEGKPDFPIYNKEKTDMPLMPHVDIDRSFNPFQNSGQRRTMANNDWEQLYQSLATKKNTDSQQTFFSNTESDKSTDKIDADNSLDSEIENIFADKSANCFQYKGQYIITSVKSGLMIIDQHRAHIRVLYEEYLDQIGSHKANTQKVLFPEAIEFSGSETPVMTSIMPQLSLMGFDIAYLGGNSFAVNGVPDGIGGINVSTLLHDMVATAMEHDGKTNDSMSERLAANLARHAAIPYGQVLSNDEMEDIIDRLFACSNVNQTPDGKTVIAIIQHNEIEKLLK